MPDVEEEFLALLGQLLAAAQGAGAVRADVTPSDVKTLLVAANAAQRYNADAADRVIVTVEEIVPTEVAAAALVIVGTLMVSVLREIDFSDFSVALPVVLTVAVMPLSYSIANGIGVGFISWAVMRTAAGKAREVSPLLWIVAVGFAVYFARAPLESLL